MKKFSVAIPTFNSSKYLFDCLSRFQNSKSVDDIIVSDDYSSDEEFIKLKSIVDIKRNDGLNISLIKNKLEKGAFNNKYNAISYCKNEKVYQIDSDNVAAKNIDDILSVYQNNLDEELIIYPSKLIQFRTSFKFANIIKNFNQRYLVNLTNSDIKFDMEKVKQSINNEINLLVDKNIFWVLNCGNFIVNKIKYLKIAHAYLDNKDVPMSADAIALSYLWLLNGGEIALDKNMYHFHRKRDDSVSFTEGEGTRTSIEHFRDLILNHN